MSPSQANWPFVINVGNSIIGVTVLAMPFCFKTCGIILSTLMLFFSTWLTIVSCQLLMKAGVTARRRSFSLLAYYTHGATGKLIVELGMIGLQLGTLIAQVVIIGDLGPDIVSKATGIPNTDNLRTGLIVILCLFVGLPLALLKDVRTLSKTSTLCILFYAFFTVYVVLLSLPNLVAGDWYNKVNMWRPAGFFQCLPIFSFAFGCQTQLFIVYDALAEPSLKRINSIVSSAVNMCTVCYLLVGFFGYIAFVSHDNISGDIINHFEVNGTNDAIKLCFVMSIAVSIPLICFPCRASLYTLLFPQKPKEDVPGAGKIPEFHFKVITFCIVSGSMVIGILIPNIEFVLGLNGATMGTLICYITPALFFLNVMSDSSERKSTGRMVLALGLIIMVASTYTTLTKQNDEHRPVKLDSPLLDNPALGTDKPANIDDLIKKDEVLKVGDKVKPPDIPDAGNQVRPTEAHKQGDKKDTIRHEPPIPQDPDDNKVNEFTKPPRNVVKEEENVKSVKDINKKADELNSKNNNDINEHQSNKDIDAQENPAKQDELGLDANKLKADKQAKENLDNVNIGKVNEEDKSQYKKVDKAEKAGNDAALVVKTKDKEVKEDRDGKVKADVEEGEKQGLDNKKENEGGKEGKADEKEKDVEKKQEEILAKLEHQQVEQEKLIQEQKEILEQLKEHQEKHKEENVNDIQNQGQKSGGLLNNKQLGENQHGQLGDANQQLNQVLGGQVNKLPDGQLNMGLANAQGNNLPNLGQPVNVQGQGLNLQGQGNGNVQNVLPGNQLNKQVLMANNVADNQPLGGGNQLNLGLNNANPILNQGLNLDSNQHNQLPLGGNVQNLGNNQLGGNDNLNLNVLKQAPVLQDAGVEEAKMGGADLAQGQPHVRNKREVDSVPVDTLPEAQGHLDKPVEAKVEEVHADIDGKIADPSGFDNVHGDDVKVETVKNESVKEEADKEGTINENKKQVGIVDNHEGELKAESDLNAAGSNNQRDLKQTDKAQSLVDEHKFIVDGNDNKVKNDDQDGNIADNNKVRDASENTVHQDKKENVLADTVGKGDQVRFGGDYVDEMLADMKQGIHDQVGKVMGVVEMDEHANTEGKR